MAVGLTSTDFVNIMSTLYSKQFMEVREETRRLVQLSDDFPIGKQEGLTADFPGYNYLAPVTGALTEGDSGSEGALQTRNETVTIEEWGKFFKPSTLAYKTGRDRGLKEAIKRIEAQGADTEELVAAVAQSVENGLWVRADNDATYTKTGTPTSGSTSTMVDAGFTGVSNDTYNGGRFTVTAKDGANFARCRGISDSAVAGDNLTLTFGGSSMYTIGTRQCALFPDAIDTTDDYRFVAPGGLTTGDILTSSNIRLATRLLNTHSVKPPNLTPIRGKEGRKNSYYIGLLDPENYYDVQSDTDWKAVNTYKDATDGIFSGEVGMLWGVRWILWTIPYRQSTSSYAYDAAGAVHVVPILGRGALTRAYLEGDDRHVIIKPSNKYNTDDPLDMFLTIGWKEIYAFKSKNACNSVNIMTYPTA